MVGLLSGQRKKRIEHIESYQVSRNLIDTKYEGAYVDPVLIEFSKALNASYIKLDSYNINAGNCAE